ncbi:MAG: hypothetical protein ABI472_04155 [Ginsengibacter sp.]
MKERDYKLHRAVLQSMTFEEADDHVTNWNNKTESERLHAACFLINQIFNVSPSDKIDLQFTDKRKHSNG